MKISNSKQVELRREMQKLGLDALSDCYISGHVQVKVRLYSMGTSDFRTLTMGGLPRLHDLDRVNWKHIYGID